MVRNIQRYDRKHTRLYEANIAPTASRASQMHQTTLIFDLVENGAAAQSYQVPLGDGGKSGGNI